ncbi:sulfurtransferase [[Pseudomonas] boreopolis]|uniref:Thiosulfate sulfurtransferase n=1 Tax=Xanthomonas boreopolis TaxID=86183 RepID=A0A919F5U5_9XANT|nr:thiosulfate sulfurtransferase [[Pseudomonas] boreopolis]
MSLPTWNTLVDAPTLAASLERADLRIVDARFALNAPDWGREEYFRSHVPGSVYADLNKDLSDLGRSGEGRHPLPQWDLFAVKLGLWGIRPDTQVVVYDAGDGSMAAARLWWLLRVLGHRAVAVLDGGLAAWRAVGLPETGEMAAIEDAGPYPGAPDPGAIAEAGEVLARLPQPAGWLWDARAPERFRGEVEPIDPVAGHVPGAVNRPFAANLEDGRFKPAARLRAELEAVLDGRPPRETVLMCGSGVTACHLLLAMEVAGLQGARVYAGSWSGWISDPARPITAGA